VGENLPLILKDYSLSCALSGTEIQRAKRGGKEGRKNLKRKGKNELARFQKKN